MNRKSLFIVAAAGVSALTPGPAVAAVDDSGMKYISASEGLSGSIRIRMYDDGNREKDNAAVGFDDSRIVYQGQADVGGGSSVTYLFEFRPGDPTDTRTVDQGRSQLNQFRIEYMDVGLRSKFGHVRVGAIESASSAIVPSPDRTNDVGDDGSKLAGDYRNGGWRWVSPEIRGLLLGVSAAMEDRIKADNRADTDEKKIDQYDVAVSYSLPAGLDIGASYSLLHPIDVDFDDKGERQRGFRLGVSYARTGWGIGYNFHKYDSMVPDGKAFVQGSGGNPNACDGSVGSIGSCDANLHKDTEYKEHVLGANISYGKFNFAAMYSLSNISNSTLDTIAGNDGVQGVDVDFKTAAVDVAYRIGSKAKLIAAYKTDKVTGDNLQSGDVSIPVRAGGKSNKKYYLLTRVDF